MQFKTPSGNFIHSTGKLDDDLYEIKSVDDFCKLMNSSKFNKFCPQDKRFMFTLAKFFQSTKLIIKQNNKYHVKGQNEPLDVFFKKSNRRLDTERKQAQAQFVQIPSYTQYVPAYHEDYVYSDANWHPSLASL